MLSPFSDPKSRLTSGSDRRGLTHHLSTRYPQGFRNPADLPLPEDGAEINPRLRVYEGFACCTCRTINYHELTKHISKEHLGGRQATRARIDHLYHDVYLQTWTQGASRRYWIVKKDGSLTRPVADRGASEHIQSLHGRERARAGEVLQYDYCCTNTSRNTPLDGEDAVGDHISRVPP